MSTKTKLEDLIGFGHTKLGFFGEVQKKISELQASNQELESKRQEIQAILDGITDVMVVLSLDFRIISVNSVFHDVFGADNPRGAYCYQFFRNADKPCPDCIMCDALKKNAVSRSMVILPVNGKNLHFEVSASPLRDADGKPATILMLLRDVTLEKEYQAKYLYAEKMATIGLLASGVAHEINNPLAGISGFAEGIKRRLPRLKDLADENAQVQALADDMQEYVETILAECNRCRDIVKTLLTFAPRHQPEFECIDVNALVNDVLKLLHHKLKHHPSGTIRLQMTGGLPYARAVSAEIKQVILNLVLNALYAIKDKGRITIQTRVQDKRWIVISVQDTGCGIPGEYRHKLFEPFFTTKPVGKGIGIGLATCYSIIQRHSGEITVDSEEGKGSTFNVKLPMPLE